MMIGRGQQLLMADADGATRMSDLSKLEDALKQLNNPGDSTAHSLSYMMAPLRPSHFHHIQGEVGVGGVGGVWGGGTHVATAPQSCPPLDFSMPAFTAQS